MTDPPGTVLMVGFARMLRLRQMVEWLSRHVPDTKPGPCVLVFWSSPWSGDEADPIPRRYWLWHRLYRWTRTAKHWIDWHDWRPIGRHMHCDWCGASKPIPLWVQRLYENGEGL